MCRNITTLRGLEPPATRQEIEDAARQFVRKVAGVSAPSSRTADALEHAISEIAAATERLLLDMPPRRQPPRHVPPGRR